MEENMDVCVREREIEIQRTQPSVRSRVLLTYHQGSISEEYRARADDSLCAFRVVYSKNRYSVVVIRPIKNIEHLS